MDSDLYLVFSEDGWCSEVMNRSALTDYDCPANVRTVRITGNPQAFIASVQAHAWHGTPIDWNIAEEI